MNQQKSPFLFKQLKVLKYNVFETDKSQIFQIDYSDLDNNKTFSLNAHCTPTLQRVRILPDSTKNFIMFTSSPFICWNYSFISPMPVHSPSGNKCSGKRSIPSAVQHLADWLHKIGILTPIINSLHMYDTEFEHGETFHHNWYKCRQITLLCYKMCAAYIPSHSPSSTLWEVYKLIMLTTHCPLPPASWVLILPTSEGWKAEWTLSRLPGIWTPGREHSFSCSTAF